MTRRAALGSSEAMGSSAMITLAPCTSVRAMAARCCWPPDSSEPRLQGLFGDADAGERLHGALLLGGAEPGERAAPAGDLTQQPEADVGQHRQARHEVELLEDDADARSQPRGGRADAPILLHRLAQDADAPACRCVFARRSAGRWR